MSKEATIKLSVVANTFVTKELDKGRVPSDFDVCDYLDHWLEKYERDHGDIVTEDECESITNEITEILLEDGRIYKWKDWNLYYNMVRSKGLVSTQEHSMHKNIVNNSDRRIIFRDTEFPVDENGCYTAPN